MRLTINFIEGTKINGQLVARVEKHQDFTLEQVTQFLEGLDQGYDLRFNNPNQESTIISASQVKSVEVTL
jgi:hypothetical protein